MKYVALLTIIVLMVRIDVLLKLFDNTASSFEPAPPEIKTSDIANRELISVTEDKTLKQNPRDNFLLLLEDFRTSPSQGNRERAMLLLKDNSSMFADQLDKELEGNIFRWRELMNNNEPELVNFLLELMKVLKGENLEMIKRFFSLWMDIDMANFISAYSRTQDSNCSIATKFGYKIPEEEVLNEYYERHDELKAYLEKEKIDPAHRALADNCLLVLKIEIDKIAPKPLPSEEPPQLDPGVQGMSP